MARELSADSRLESLKKEAKRWLKALRDGDEEARARFRRIHPSAGARPGLREVQQALAREHGLESWAALKLFLDDLELARQSADERAADLLELASLHYGVPPGTRTYSGYPDGPARHRRALRIVERHPEVARHSLHTAVLCGDLEEVHRILARRPGAVGDKGGRERWEPLLFLAYGRLPLAAAADNAVAIATALLDHGADPNTAWSYDWEGGPMPWSALCGVIGDGERGPVACPLHPRAEALATLLLDRGADPNQSQALYNTMLRGDDPRWLRMLVARGLGPRDPINWGGPGTGGNLFHYLLSQAVDTGQLARAQVLVEAGADPNPHGERSFYERALLAGHVALAELLARHGARRSELSGGEAFRAACLRVDGAAARALLAEHPEHIAEAGALLMGEAASRDLVEAARLLLELGVSPDAEHEGCRALHRAACMNATAVTAFLLAHGARVDLRDRQFQATPLGWALHTTMPGTTELLGRHTRDVFTVVAGGLTERLRALLAEDPGMAQATAERSLGLGRQSAELGDTPLFVLPEDEDRALEIAELLLAAGADRAQRNSAGQTAADRARARGLDAVADLLTG
jgi:ankyrin repeat protein